MSHRIPRDLFAHVLHGRPVNEPIGDDSYGKVWFDVQSLSWKGRDGDGPVVNLLNSLGLTDDAPPATAVASSVGVSAEAARADHTHASPQLTNTAPPAIGPVSLVGVSTEAARADHTHENSGGSATTTDDTPTDLVTFVVPDNSATLIDCLVVARRSDGSERAGLVLKALIVASGGVITADFVDQTVVGLVGPGPFTWTVGLASTGLTGKVQVTGVDAVTIDWTGVLRTAST